LLESAGAKDSTFYLIKNRLEGGPLATLLIAVQEGKDWRRTVVAGQGVPEAFIPAVHICYPGKEKPPVTISHNITLQKVQDMTEENQTICVCAVKFKDPEGEKARRTYRFYYYLHHKNRSQSSPAIEI